MHCIQLKCISLIFVDFSCLQGTFSLKLTRFRFVDPHYYYFYFFYRRKRIPILGPVAGPDMTLHLCCVSSDTGTRNSIARLVFVI